MLMEKTKVGKSGSIRTGDEVWENGCPAVETNRGRKEKAYLFCKSRKAS